MVLLGSMLECTIFLYIATTIGPMMKRKKVSPSKTIISIGTPQKRLGLA